MQSLPVTYRPKVKPQLTLTGQQSAVKLQDKNGRRMQLVILIPRARGIATN